MNWIITTANGVRRFYSSRLAFILIGVAVISVGIFIVHDLRRTNEEAGRLQAGLVRGLELIGELQYNTQEARRSMLYALSTSDANLQVDYADQSRAADAQVMRVIEEGIELSGSPAEINAGREFQRDWQSYLETRDEVIASILEGSIKEAVERDLRDGVPAFNKVRDDVQEVKRLYEEQASRQLAEVQASSNRSVAKLMLILLVTQLFVGLAVRAVQKGKMLAALRESEERYRDLVQGLDAIVWEADAATSQFVFVSQRAEAILGHPLERWRSETDFWSKCIHPEDREKALAHCRAALQGGEHEFEYRVVAADGRVLWLRDIRRVVRDSKAQPRQVRGLMVDVTEHKKMEEELLRVQKLESVGVLAGGIAHDFNNILTAIMGNIALAKMSSSSNERVCQRLTAAETAAVRARDLTQQLLTFSKGGAPVKVTVPVGELIKESASFALSGSSSRCELSIADDLWPAEVDQGQISRVVYNLVINAQQAMPSGGVVRVQAENTVVMPDLHLPLLPGRYVRLSIEDRGIGIPQENLQRVFDPYFTTKIKGNGLGLAAAYSIVKKHDGHISVDSRVGAGTVFTIYLPATTRDLREAVTAEKTSVNGLRVLVMDDEEPVREVTGELLRQLGCKACLVCDGAEALDRYREATEIGTPFDLVILDLTVPGGMGGKETIRHLLKLDPKVRAIVSSGYSNDPAMAEFRECGFCGVIAKPYKIQELGRAVATAMEHRVVG
jgi:PAS domain S-box-containing protein